MHSDGRGRLSARQRWLLRAWRRTEAWRRDWERAQYLEQLPNLRPDTRIGPDAWIISGETITFGADVSIGRRARLQCLVGSGEPAAAGRIHFGDRASLEDGCHVGALGPVVIGDDVLIASHVLLLDHGHEYDDPSVPISRQPLRGGGLTIGEGSHIGEGACVLGPVAVGRHSVIGAGAVVVRDVPDLTVVGGVPARPLKRYDADVGRWVPA